MDPPEAPNNGLKPLKFTRVTLGQWRLFLKVESDFQFNFEPYFGVSLLYHSVTHQYLWRIWGRTRESGFVQSYPEIIAKCGQLFDRGVPCVGMKPLDDGFPLSCVFAEDCLGIVLSSEDSNVCQKCRIRRKLDNGEEMEVTDVSVSRNSLITAEETDSIDEFPNSPKDINPILSPSVALKSSKDPLEVENLNEIENNIEREKRDRVQCPYCSQKVAQRFIRTHQMYNHQFGQFKCNVCSDSMNSAPDLTKHSSVAHPKNEELMCPNCWKRISIIQNPNELVHHIQSCHKVKYMINPKGDLMPLRNFCLACWTTFKTQEELQTHEKSSCSQHCAFCNFEGRLETYLAYHMNKCHPEIVPEKMDPPLLVPVKVRKPEKVKKSDKVKKPEKVKKTKKVREIKNVEEPEKPTLVRFCFWRKSRFTDCEPKTNIVCDQCGKVLANRDGFRFHVKEYHGPENMCDQCEKTFSTADKLEAHINLVHLKTDKFTCLECGRRCGNQRRLASHIRIHKPARFICTTCGKQSKTKIALEQHNRIHTGEKPFKCNLCDYATAVGGNLGAHKKFVHGGVSRNPRRCRDSNK